MALNVRLVRLCNAAPAGRGLCVKPLGVRGIASAASGIPVVDFGAFRQSADAASRRKAAAAVLDACVNVGFVYLKNHGVSPASVRGIFGQSKQFFDLPLDVKRQVAWETPESNRGWVELGREKLTEMDKHGASREDISALREAQPDRKESFEIGPDYPNGGTRPWEKYSNRFPPSSLLPSFKSTTTSFFQECHLLHLEVLSAIATGLGLDPRWFDKYCDKGDHNLRLLHYPSVDKKEIGKGDRAGAHCDYGSITLLFQDHVGGLQVRAKSGEFVDATPIPDTVVVNVGDLLERWSNDVLKSTEHRVVSNTSSNSARYSVAFFCNPNFEASIETIDACISPQRPPKYPPVNSYDYLVSRLSATY